MSRREGKRRDETRGDAGCGFGRLRISDGWRRGGWGSRGDCRLPSGLEEITCCSAQRRGAAAETAFPPPPHRGEKGDSRAWGSPPQSFRTLLFLTACLWLSSVASPPSFGCGQELEMK